MCEFGGGNKQGAHVLSRGNEELRTQEGPITGVGGISIIGLSSGGVPSRERSGERRQIFLKK